MLRNIYALAILFHRTKEIYVMLLFLLLPLKQADLLAYVLFPFSFFLLLRSSNSTEWKRIASKAKKKKRKQSKENRGEARYSS